MRVKRGIVVSDEQIPNQIDLSPVNKFIRDFKPDYFFRLGDMLDMTPLLGWTNAKPALVDWEAVREEIRIANRIFDIQDELLPPGCEKRYSFGNHEERLMWFRKKHEGTDWWRRNQSTVPYLMRDLRLRERGYKTYGQNELHRVGKLHFFHGDEWGLNHTRTNVRNYCANLVYGHVHRPERATKTNPIGKHFNSAWSLGCLCDLDPGWRNKKPNGWVNGFGVFWVLPNGNFQFNQIDIVKGEFIGPNGKLYR